MSPQTHMPRIGGHVGASGGLINAILRAKEIGAETIQLFGSSPRMWRILSHSPDEIKRFHEAAEREAVKPIFLHASYLINLASPDALLRKKSEESLQLQLELANLLRADGLIFHIGSTSARLSTGGKETPKEEALETVVDSIQGILNRTKGNADLIIENSAGGGQKIGSSVKEIGEIIRRVLHPRLKFCFDTAHAFAAGLIEEYTPGNITQLCKDIEGEIGFQRLAALHVNDSKVSFNSHRDLHENIGAGFIGLKGFQNLARFSQFLNASWILEVPGHDDTGPDKKNIDILKSLFAENT